MKKTISIKWLLSTDENLSYDNCQRVLSLSRFGAILAALFSISAFAAPVCKPTKNDGQICSVVINFAGQYRSYQYEIRSAEPGKPTIIEIPGGPGQGYIGKMEEATSGGLIPKGYGVVAIDPRGVGTNDYGPDRKGGNYTSDLEVNDILQVIKKENLQNYMIHGQSYGTLVATKLGEKLSFDRQVTKPRAIILSGVVNSAFDDQLSGYNQQLQRTIRDLCPQEKAELQRALSDLKAGPFKGDQIAFSGALMNGLLFNIEDEHSAFGVGTPNFKKFLKMLASDKIDENNPVYQLMLNAAQKNAGKTPDFSEVKRRSTMAEEIKCSEMSILGEEARVSFDIQSLQLKLDHSDCQKKGYKISNPYDSKIHQISGIPLYYFQGSIDPATPDADARKHYGSQSKTEKIYISIDGYSHMNLLGMTKCQTGLWDAISQSPTELEKNFKTCDDPNVKILGHQKPSDASSADSIQSPGIR